MNGHNKFNTQGFRQDYYKHYNLKKKWLNVNANIWFNRTCTKNNLIPHYAKSKNRPFNKASHITNQQYSKLRMCNELKFLYKKKDYLSLQLYNHELKMMKLHETFWNFIKFEILTKLKNFTSKKYEKLNNKIKKLQQPKNRINIPEQKFFQFHDSIQNLSNIQFEKEELIQISKNYKSNFVNPTIKSQIENIVVETEHIIKTSDIKNKEALKYQIHKITDQYIQKNLHNKNTLQNQNNNKIKSVVNKIKTNNLTVSKADKGNVLTIQDKDVLQNKTLEYLNNPIYKKSKTDPTTRYQKEIRQVIKQANQIINKSNNFIINANPSAPRLRVSTKIHKKNYPIRPIVNYKTAPAYKLKKRLGDVLKLNLIIQNKFNIKNSLDLTKQLNNVQLSPNSKFISLDIKDMYSNIPINETIEIIRKQLNILDKDPQFSNQLIKLLDTTLKQNYFSYNNNIYIQQDGLPMGSPLSPIISEIFLQDIELQHIEKIKQQFNLQYYGRYVDDVFIVYDNHIDNSEKIVEHFNTLHPKLKFTLEKENNKILNFLDLTIMRVQQKNNTKFSYKIYRKPITSKLAIDYNSSHTKSHKWANFRFLLNRLNNIPLSKKNYKIEFEIIKDIAKFNSFPVKEIYILNNKIKANLNKKKLTTLHNNNIKKKWANLSYCGKISDKIGHIFKKNNINIAYKNRNQHQKELKNVKHEYDKMNCSGIYQLKCKCEAAYIGKTTRKFKQRYNEHKHSFVYNYPEKSNFAKHLLKEHHPFDTKYFKIKKIVNNNPTIDTWEELEIYKEYHSGNILNEQLTNINNPLFSLITKYF